MASGIPESTLDEIRARIDIVSLIDSRVPLKKVGGRFKACCPFHQEKTPSFVVDPVKQVYHCFGCQEGGDIFAFLMKLDGLRFPDAVKMLAERAGVVVKLAGEEQRQRHQWLYTLHAELAAFYQHCLLEKPEANVARKYLTDRKLSLEAIAPFTIGYAPTTASESLLKWAESHGYTPEQLITAGVLYESSLPNTTRYRDRFRGRLIFPIHDRQGRVVAFSARLLQPNAKAAKYVNSPETPIFVKSRILYAFDKAAGRIVKHPRREAVICEGQIDVIRCHISGFETAVASQGTAFTEEHVKLLKRYADSVVLVFDGDSAGRKAAIRTGQYFLAEEIPVRVAQIPAGDDPDSLLRDKGADVFRDLLECAPSITAHQVACLMQEEKHPDSVDGINRISRAVLDMLSTCPGAVLRTRLLQEAAELMHLPYSAMADDLDKHREELARRSAYTHEAKDSKSQVPVVSGQPSLSGQVARGVCSEEGGGTEPLEPTLVMPSRAEYLLCEFLIEHERDEEVLPLIATMVPLRLLHHPLVRQIVAAILLQRENDEDGLAHLYRETLSEWKPLFEKLLAQDQKMLSARELTKIDAAQDLIRRLWVMHFRQEQEQLKELSDTAGLQRISLSILIKQVTTQPWEQICHLIASHMPMDGITVKPDQAVDSVAGAENREALAAFSGHAVDNACEASDPEEFQPNAFQPDETID